jgi:hypothetical protein
MFSVSTPQQLDARLAAKAMGAAKSLASLIMGFSKGVWRSISRAQYKDRNLVIYSGGQDMSTTEEYGIGYDFGFRGSGNIEEPFGFKVDRLGRHRYTPIEAQLFPGVIPDFSDPTGMRKKPISLGSGLAPGLIKGLLSIFVGGRDNAEKLWSPVAYFTRIKPETAFYLKTIILVMSAGRNTKARRGYPRLTDVPVELMFLLFRLAATPDIERTIVANGGLGVEKAHQWKNIHTLSRPSSLINKMPSFLVKIISSVKPSIDIREIQEYRDREGKPPTYLEKLYGQLRQLRPYESRLDFILSDLIPKVNVGSLHKTDENLLNYAIRQLVAERYRGLSVFVGKDTIVDRVGEMSVEHNQDDDMRLIEVDLRKVVKFIDKRRPALEAFLKSLQEKHLGIFFKSTQQYINEVVTKISEEFGHIKRLADDVEGARQGEARLKQKILEEGNYDAIMEAQGSGQIELLSDEQLTSLRRLQGLKRAEQEASERILEYLRKIESQESGEVGAAANRKKSLSLPQYLDIKFFSVMQIMRQRFKGDNDYIYDDSRLPLHKGLTHAFSILFRATRDLTYLENLIRTDSRKFVMESEPEKRGVANSGVRLYKRFVDTERYLLFTERELVLARRKRQNLSVQNVMQDQYLMQLNQKADQAAMMYERARAELRHYLRQYTFDRRLPRRKKVSQVFEGESSMEGLDEIGSLEVSFDHEDSKAEENDSKSEGSSDDLGGDGELVEEGKEAKDSEGELSMVDKLQGKKNADFYDYPRTVNDFMLKEFARLFLRCPKLLEVAERELAQACREMTGMQVSQLLRASAGEKEHIQIEEDEMFLPGEDLLLAEDGELVMDEQAMDELEKSLLEQYGGLDDELMENEDLSIEGVEDINMDEFAGFEDDSFESMPAQDSSQSETDLESSGPDQVSDATSDSVAITDFDDGFSQASGEALEGALSDEEASFGSFGFDSSGFDEASLGQGLDGFDDFEAFDPNQAVQESTTTGSPFVDPFADEDAFDPTSFESTEDGFEAF